MTSTNARASKRPTFRQTFICTGITGPCPHVHKNGSFASSSHQAGPTLSNIPLG